MEASWALRRGSDQGPCDLRRAERHDLDSMPGDCSSNSGSSSSYSPPSSSSTAPPRQRGENVSQGPQGRSPVSPARSTISVAGSSSRGRPPPPRATPHPPHDGPPTNLPDCFASVSLTRIHSVDGFRPFSAIYCPSPHEYHNQKPLHSRLTVEFALWPANVRSVHKQG